MISAYHTHQTSKQGYCISVGSSRHSTWATVWIPVHAALRTGRNLSDMWRSTFKIMSATQPRSLTPYLCVNRSPPNRWLCPGLCLNLTLQKDFPGILGMSFRFGPTSEILENIQYGGPSVVKSVILVWFLWRQDFNAGNKQFISLFCSYFWLGLNHRPSHLRWDKYSIFAWWLTVYFL